MYGWTNTYNLTRSDFILLVKQKLIDAIHPHEGFAVSAKYFSLKCFSTIVIFHISSWLVDNTADIPSFESVSDIKALYIDKLGSLTT